MASRRRSKNPVHAMVSLIKRQTLGVKVMMGVVVAIASLIFLGMVVHDHDSLFVAAEAIHSIGIATLIFKLTKDKTCAGLSLKSQELTALFLGTRLYCSFVMEYDIHTLLDSATLITTCWVIYMIRFKLKSTYIAELDNLYLYYLAIPCLLLAVAIHPTTTHYLLNRILWAFCVYLESVSVLPQLRVMQNAKVKLLIVIGLWMVIIKWQSFLHAYIAISPVVVEPFTAHYVFALGVARFLSCAHWVLQILDSHGRLLTALGYGLWPSMVLLSEVVQTFILADFCYYYVKSVMDGQMLVSLPS